MTSIITTLSNTEVTVLGYFVEYVLIHPSGLEYQRPRLDKVSERTGLPIGAVETATDRLESLGLLGTKEITEGGPCALFVYGANENGQTAFKNSVDKRN